MANPVAMFTALFRRRRHINQMISLAVCIICVITFCMTLFIVTETNIYRRRRITVDLPDTFEGANQNVAFKPPSRTLSGRIMPTPDQANSNSSLNYTNSKFENIKWSIPEKRTNTNYSHLLTLFTTLKDNENRTRIHTNTIRNWAALGPHVQLVLFVENNTNQLYIDMALGLGWKVHNVTKTNKGIPIIKHMFLEIMDKYNSLFYGYANADILFDSSLVENMKAIASYGNITESVFVIGKRSNLNSSSAASRYLDPSNLENVTLTHRNATLFETNAQDYFITTRWGFPWHLIPDLVVGRAGYDNWLVVMAQVWSTVVIDATYTLNALHQTGFDGNRSGWAATEDKCINREIIGKFNYLTGHTKCVPYITYRDIAGIIKVFKRPKVSLECDSKHRRYHFSGYNGCV